MKIVFMGTPEFGAIILEGLVKDDYKPALVITEPDKPVGRKQIITPPPVKVTARKNNIEILQPVKILDSKFYILDSKPDLIIVAAYGQILPKDILEIPKYGCLNVHPSLLPRWRGPSPIQFAILNGDEETGVTIMKITEKMDAGPVLTNSKLPILNSSITYEELHNKLAKEGAKLLLETIPKWLKGEIKPAAQDESKVTFSKILTRKDGEIDWQKPAEEIERQVRAFSFWPGTSALLDAKNLKIIKTSVMEQTKNGPFGTPGKTFLAPDDKIAVQTGKGFLIIERLQLEGKNPVSTADFLKGYKDFIGKILE